LVGTPFRLHGRDPAAGLDCVGLVAAAFDAIGIGFHPPDRYGLRNRTITPLLALLGDVPARRLGLSDRSSQTGDIVLGALGSSQNHVVILSGGFAGHASSFIHAHAGLRRVVRTPGDIPWPIIARWRPDFSGRCAAHL